MEVVGTIKKIFPKVEGSTEKGEFCIQPIELEVTESYVRADGTQSSSTNSILVDITGSKAQSFSLQQGQRVRVNLRFQVREYNGRAFQKISTIFIYAI